MKYLPDLCLAICCCFVLGCGDDGTKESAVCGDGVVGGDEVCDLNDLSGLSCDTFGFSSGTLKCTDTCEIDTSGCTNAAQTGVCGNGKIDSGEACDQTEFAGQTCQTMGFVDGTLKCSDSCTIDTSGCFYNTLTGCGNGKIDGSEACDQTDLGGQTCQSMGFTEGTLKCSNSCTLDTSDCSNPTVPAAVCGDGKLDSGEACDKTDLGGQTCQSMGFAEGTLKCSDSCKFDTSDCSNPTIPTGECGDGNINAGEQCDSGNLNQKSCKDMTGFVGGTLKCSSCQFDTTECTECTSTDTSLCKPDQICSSEGKCTDKGQTASCGNGVAEGDEECDKTDLRGQKCDVAGTLKCTANCKLDKSECTTVECTKNADCANNPNVPKGNDTCTENHCTSSKCSEAQLWLDDHKVCAYRVDNSNLTDFLAMYANGNVNQLYQLNGNKPPSFVLMEDVELPEKYSWKGWYGFGLEKSPFDGIFEGNKHTIKGNIKCDSSVIACALFPYAKGAKIVNLDLKVNVDAKVSMDADFPPSAALLIGSGESCKIDNVHADGNVTNNGTYSGGLMVFGNDIEMSHVSYNGSIQKTNLPRYFFREDKTVVSFLGGIIASGNDIRIDDAKVSGTYEIKYIEDDYDYLRQICGEVYNAGVVGKVSDVVLSNVQMDATVVSDLHCYAPYGSGYSEIYGNIYNAALIAYAKDAKLDNVSVKGTVRATVKEERNNSGNIGPSGTKEYFSLGIGYAEKASINRLYTQSAKYYCSTPPQKMLRSQYLAGMLVDAKEAAITNSYDETNIGFSINTIEETGTIINSGTSHNALIGGAAKLTASNIFANTETKYESVFYSKVNNAKVDSVYYPSDVKLGNDTATNAFSFNRTTYKLISGSVLSQLNKNLQDKIKSLPAGKYLPWVAKDSAGLPILDFDSSKDKWHVIQ